MDLTEDSGCHSFVLIAAKWLASGTDDVDDDVYMCVYMYVCMYTLKQVISSPLPVIPQ